MNSAITLLSGGLESAVSLAVIKNQYKNILALTFNYGQISFHSEYKSAKTISDYFKIKHITVELDWLKNISASSLNKGINIPQLTNKDLDNVILTEKSAKAVWVPNRNGLFVNIAACYAEAFDYDTIIIGANKEEGATFKDNTPEFIKAINNSFKNSVNKKLELIAPFINLNKTEIVKKGTELDFPFEFLHSCYENSDKHCGKCESCVRLKRALELNERYDIIDKLFN